MRRGLWLVIVGGFAAIAIAVPVKLVARHTGRAGTAATAAVGGDFTVHMAGLKFAPGDLVVRRGKAVTFDNDDLAPHTVTEDGAGGVDSGVLSPGKAFRLVVSRRLVYHCAIHPFMTATIDLAG
jgi:plastocyanin